MVDVSHSFPASYNGWMFDEAAGGGPLLSSGIYAMQLLCWLFGGIKSIRGVASKLESGVEWQYMLSGETESGALFCAKNSTRATLDNTCRIFGENGFIELPNYWKARNVILHLGSTPEILEFPCEHELVYELEHIAQCFQQGLLSSPVITKELSVQGIAALEQVKANW